MIQYVCDFCGRSLDPEHELRYVVRVEVYAALDDSPLDDSDDLDHFQELDEIIEKLEDERSTEISDEVFQTLRYDLCPNCRAHFVKSPLGQPQTRGLHFSEN